jgi:hypothetical protein
VGTDEGLAPGVDPPTIPAGPVDDIAAAAEQRDLVAPSETIEAPTIAPLTLPAATPPPTPASAPTRPPRVTETIGGALDLALAASKGVRRVSLYVGFVSLALAGPTIVLLLAVIRDNGGFEDVVGMLAGASGGLDESTAGALSLLRFAAFFAAVGIFAISIEGQILAATVVAGAATGRSIGIRGGLRLSRVVFWQVVGAGILVGLLDTIVSNATQAVTLATTHSLNAATVLGILVAGIATMPFAFFQSGIIMGGVGAIEALRRSTRVARVRWRLALIVALAGTVISVIEVFALGAGLDLVLRVADAAGLGLDKSLPAAILTGLLILAFVVALGSLIVTVAALVAAPQVYVFVKLTGYSQGLARTEPPVGYAPPTRIVTRAMLTLIILAGLAALVGFLAR